jgi:hypothetical protein
MECTHHLSRFCGTLMMRVYAERQAPIVKEPFSSMTSLQKRTAETPSNCVACQGALVCTAGSQGFC